MIAEIVEQLDRDLRAVNEEFKAESGVDIDVAEHLQAYITNGKSGQLMVELSRDEDRPANGKDLELRWRQKAGEIAGTRELRFSSGMHMGGEQPIALALKGHDYRQVEQAAEELVAYLKTFEGLFEVESSADAGPEEVKLRIKPEAEALGVTLADLGRQVREAFYGAEAQRIQRGTEEVKVMVRYPRVERSSIGNLERMWIRLPDGRETAVQLGGRLRNFPGLQHRGATRRATHCDRDIQCGPGGGGASADRQSGHPGVSA